MAEVIDMANVTCGELAGLLDFPAGSAGAFALVERARRISLACAGGQAEQKKRLDRFATGIEEAESVAAGSAEELYISTFEISAVTHLYAGYHLFGESRRRNELMVRVKDMAVKHGLEVAETELPDHLPFLLRLLDRLEAADAAELCELVVEPALGLVAEKLRGDGVTVNPYSYCVEALRGLVTNKLPVAELSGC